MGTPFDVLAYITAIVCAVLCMIYIPKYNRMKKDWEYQMKYKSTMDADHYKLRESNQNKSKVIKNLMRELDDKKASIEILEKQNINAHRIISDLKFELDKKQESTQTQPIKVMIKKKQLL